MWVVAIIVFATNAFSAEWYAKGKGYEKCMKTEDGFLVCREDYVNDFCYGKERIWLERKLVAARILNYKCEYHGWSRFRLVNDKWAWQCYLNSKEAKDEDCKGFRKR